MPVSYTHLVLGLRRAHVHRLYPGLNETEIIYIEKGRTALPALFYNVIWREALGFVIARALCARGNLGKALTPRTGHRENGMHRLRL